MLDTIELNKIKIRDIFAALKKDVDPNSSMGLIKLDLLEKREEIALNDPSDEALRRTERLLLRTS